MTAIGPWVVLVVDDEPEVLRITRAVLARLASEDRGLEILEAGSAREAREVLARRSDVALMLVDIVMETGQAGLDLIRHVRNELGNRTLRIILRTGHPSRAHALDVIRDYAISDYREKTDLTARKLEIAVMLALQAYRELMAFETARDRLAAKRASLQDIESSERLRRALFAITDLSGSGLDLADLLRGIHAQVRTLMYAENFFVVLYEEEHDSFRFPYFVDVADRSPWDPDLEIPMREREYSLIWHLLRSGRPMMGDTAQLRDQVLGPLEILGPYSRDWLGVPMLRDGRVHGAVVVQSYREDIRFSVEDRALLEFVAHHILTALERKQSKEDLEQRVLAHTLELRLEIEERHRTQRLQTALFQIAQLATTDISESAFYQRVHAVVGELINANNFCIALLSEDGSSLELVYVVDEIDPAAPSRLLGLGLGEMVLREGQTLLGRAQIEQLVRQGLIDSQTSGTPAEWWLGVPLRVGELTIGLIVVQTYDEASVYRSTDQELLGFVASQVANSLQRRRSADALQRAYAELEQRVQERTHDLRKEIVERERLQHQLTHQVLHDALTRLPNRGYLRDRIERVLGLLQRNPERRCALLFIDVDKFKFINDSMGHLVGDEVLREIALRLLTCVRQPDVVARISGDEFAILLEDVPVPSTAVKVAQRVLTELAKPMRISEAELVFSASIGIAIGDSNYRLTEDILRDADSAMYRAKSLGRARFEVFDESMRDGGAEAIDQKQPSTE